MVVLLLGHRVL
jgi:hypothetical protein